MRVLLNATAQEIVNLGGDRTLYRDWLALGELGCGLGMELVSPAGPRTLSELARKALEKSCRTWQPHRARRRLFLLSRYVYAPVRRTRDADLLFSHLCYPWMPEGTGPPVVWSSQGISPPEYYERYNHGRWDVSDVAYVYRVLGRQAAALVVSTRAGMRAVLEWCPELEGKVHFAPAPVSGPGSLGPKPSQRDGLLRLLFVGVDAVRKGLVETITAYGLLEARHREVRLDVVSRPPTGLVKRLEGLDRARLHLSSPTVDVGRLMTEADVLLIPTHADTYALAAVEAMAHGCAVITSDLDPLPEVAPDGEVGYVVPAGNAEALENRLEMLVSDEASLRLLQQNARRRYLALHAPDVVARRLREIFLHVLAHERAGAAA